MMADDLAEPIPEPERTGRNRALVVDEQPQPEPQKKQNITPDITMHTVAHRSPVAWVIVQIVYRIAYVVGAWFIFRLAIERLLDPIVAAVAILSLIGGVEAITAMRGGVRAGPGVTGALVAILSLAPLAPSGLGLAIMPVIAVAARGTNIT